MKQRVRLVLAIFGAVTVVLSMAAAPASAAPAPSQQPDLRTSVRATMLAEAGARARTAYGLGADAVLETLVEPKRFSRDRSWSFGTTTFLVPPGVHAGPVTQLFLARRSGGKWNVSLHGTREFAAMTADAPAAVVTARERKPFARTASASVQAPIGLALPWEQGKGWGHWGVHGNGGNTRPYNSIDFFGPTRTNDQVRASRAGTLYRSCEQGNGYRWWHVTVVHDNGYTTGYYHLRSPGTKNDGDPVAVGEYVGLTGEELPCGGSANGNHVHWTVWQGNTGVPVQGKTIGGWTWYEGASAYTGYAERDAQRIYRNNCCPIINYGAGDQPPGKYFENAANVNVPDLGTAESAITVTGVSGNAPSQLKVYQDVHHTWRGDLQIDLIGPSGAAYRLRNPDPDDSDDIIHETDYVNASSETANGIWKLRVKDVDDNDTGYIDAWNLTF